MKEIKKALFVAGIVCLVSSMFSFAQLFSDIFYFNVATYYIVMDAIYCALSVTTGTIFLVMRNKSLKDIVAKRGMFITLLVLNIFNNLIVWAMAFWVELLVSRYSRVSTFSYNHVGEQNTKQEQNVGQDNEVVLDKDEYEIKNKVDMITEELEKLSKLKESGVITEEEYKKLKQDLLNKSFL